MAALSVAAALMTSGCQGGDVRGGAGGASPSSEKATCTKVLSAPARAAMERIAGIAAPAKATYLGDPQGAADGLVAQYDAATASEYDYEEFCGVHRGEAGVPAARVRFSLAEEAPEGEAARIFKRYRMGKAALAGVKVSVLYFECSSTTFSLGAGATVLVRGEFRATNEPSESEDAAREDTLRVVYEASSALSGLLDCESHAGLPSSFTMPAEV
ncbi:hypothetical protein JTP77_014930 [Streptomyces sp. S9]|nr:hypothetical protein [Streptomyces sp. S9]